MRIASNIPLQKLIFASAEAASYAMLGVCLIFPACAQAQGVPAQQPGNQPVVLSPSIAPAPAVPTTVTAAVPAGAVSGPAEPTSSKKGESIEKELSKAEDKAIESAKSTVNKLDVVSDETTLAELNRARQTISRIDAMIDVEKRLSELDKLRNDRQSKSGSVPAPLAGAIPASALMPPMPVNTVNVAEMPRPAPRPQKPTVSRIFGTGGKYAAVLKFPNENEKTVRVGEKLYDDETVRAISSSTVEIGGKEGSYTLHIKNVDVVYSATR